MERSVIGVSRPGSIYGSSCQVMVLAIYRPVVHGNICLSLGDRRCEAHFGVD